MFEFFIALFGGIYFGRKYSNDRSRTVEFDNNSKNKTTVLNELRLPYNLPFSYKWYDIQKGLDDRVSMLNDVSEELEYIFGKGWRKLYENYASNYTGKKPQRFEKYWMNTDGSKAKGDLWGVAYNIWLSKKGFVDISGWHLVAYQKKFCGGLPRELFDDDERNSGFSKRYINTILENLKKIHPELNLDIRNRDDMVWVITCPYGDLNLSNY